MQLGLTHTLSSCCIQPPSHPLPSAFPTQSPSPAVSPGAATVFTSLPLSPPLPPLPPLPKLLFLLVFSYLTARNDSHSSHNSCLLLLFLLLLPTPLLLTLYFLVADANCTQSPKTKSVAAAGHFTHTTFLHRICFSVLINNVFVICCYVSLLLVVDDVPSKTPVSLTFCNTLQGGPRPCLPPCATITQSERGMSRCWVQGACFPSFLQLFKHNFLIIS